MALDSTLLSRLSVGKSIKFKGMGTQVEITVWGNELIVDQLLEISPMKIELLEQSWSRFRPDSELNQLNQLGHAEQIRVSPQMAELLQRSQQAIELTNSLFFPNISDVMVDVGYDKSFELLDLSMEPSVFADRCVLSRKFKITGHYLSFDQPLCLDAGGIGKGLAGDIICREFMALGAVGVLANLGGDLVAAGSPPGSSWQLGITDDQRENQTLGIVRSTKSKFAIATSSVIKRRWGKANHHIINPIESRVAKTDISQASVVSTEGWRAEVFAKAALIKGFELADTYLSNLDLDYLLVSTTGEVKSRGVALC